MSNNRDNGNAAAIREALKAFVCYLTQKRIDEVWAKTTIPEPGLDILVAQARAALAAPARNCDVGTADEQAERFEAECNWCNNCTPCPVLEAWGGFKKGTPKSCRLIWAQMPFAPEKGGAKC